MELETRSSTKELDPGYFVALAGFAGRVGRVPIP